MRYLILFAVFYQILNCSAYCHTGNPTASGVMPAVGMAAADHLPFGAKVTLPDGTVVVIRDRMGGNYTESWTCLKRQRMNAGSLGGRYCGVRWRYHDIQGCNRGF